jgi:molybdenum cofactor cytidylyltransferase
MISGILLAAGESKRMEGAFKPLLKWGKRTVIGECVYQLRNSRLAEIFVVLGHRELEVRQSLAGSGVQYAINRNYRNGMLSSIKAGLELLSPNEDAVLIALVDQPMIKSSLINRLILAFEEGDKGIVLPVYEGKHGHPIIMSTAYVDEIMQLDDDSEGGLRELINANRDDWLEVAVEIPGVLEDIDSPADYQRLSRQAESIYAYNKWHP